LSQTDGTHITEHYVDTESGSIDICFFVQLPISVAEGTHSQGLIRVCVTRECTYERFEMNIKPDDFERSCTYCSARTDDGYGVELDMMHPSRCFMKEVTCHTIAAVY